MADEYVDVDIYYVQDGFLSLFGGEPLDFGAGDEELSMELSTTARGDVATSEHQLNDQPMEQNKKKRKMTEEAKKKKAEKQRKYREEKKTELEALKAENEAMRAQNERLKQENELLKAENLEKSKKIKECEEHHSLWTWNPATFLENAVKEMESSVEKDDI